MATYTAYGNTVNDFRLKMTVTTYAGYCIVSVWGQALGYGHSWSATLSRYGAWSGSNAVNMQSGWGEYKDVLFYSAQVNGAGTKSFGAQVNTPFGNSAVTVDNVPIPSSVPAPSPPTNLSVTRTGETTCNITFNKGANAATTQITADFSGYPPRSWYNLANPSGSSQAVVGLTLDGAWRFAAYSKNSAGSSAVVGPTAYLYTRPATPTTPTVTRQPNGAYKLEWTSAAYYQNGWEVQRGNDTNGWATVAAFSGQTVNVSWVDPSQPAPSDRYRVRGYAGPDDDATRAYSNWSPASESAMASSYLAPTLSRFEVVRCDLNGDLSEFGEYLRIVHSGSVASVKDASNTELNTRTLTARWRPKGSTAGWTIHTIVNAGAPVTWTNAVTIVGPGFSPVQAWDVQLVAEDAWNSLTQQTEIPVAATAFALSPTGASVGKIWEQGTLDVGGDTYIDGDLHVTGKIDMIHTGTVDIVSSGSNNPTAAVTFPPGAFTTPPLVWLTKRSGQLAKYVPYTNNVTKDGFIASLYSGDGTSGSGTVNVAWIAIRQGT